MHIFASSFEFDSMGCENVNIRKKYRLFLLGVLALCLAGAGGLNYVQLLEQIPDSYIQTEGEPMPDGISPLITEEVRADMAEASASAFAANCYTISYKYLGVFPMKETQVQVREPVYLTPGGIPIGIYLETQGVLIIGTGAVTGIDGLNHEPAINLVQGGDYICAVNGESIQEKEELIEAVNACDGQDVVLELERDGERIEVEVETVQTGAEEYKLGIWVRDNTQGIGTLTFLTEDGTFGALGHGINDVDTGILLKPSQGKLYDTTIVNIHKGEAGTPGELSGLIRYRDSFVCGTIAENTEAGIFGRSSERLGERLSGETLQVGYKQEIETGEALIRSSVSGELQDYQVEILEVHRNEEDVNKGIVLRVTDPELLELTGGIVQGMSGSPIIQNGKIVGAVTHVFVQDSTKGFGIFIENMLEHVEI